MMLRICSLLVCVFGAMFPAIAQDQFASGEISASFDQQIKPLLQAHCFACHDAAGREGDLDLEKYQQLSDVVESHRIWQTVLERVQAGEMPPEEDSTLNDSQRSQLVDWIQALLDAEAARNAGDPGPVLARRLNNAEYDYSIRDLTGVNLRPTKTFPVDPANEAGFDNTGESLMMSPALLRKYLAAARMVGEHMVLTPRGIHFAPHPVVTDTDRDKYCVKRIVEFYQRQPTDYNDYFFAAWRLHRSHSESASVASARVGEVATQQGLSAKYLGIVWSALTEETAQFGPLATLQQDWRKLSEVAEESVARKSCDSMEEYIHEVRKLFEPRLDDLYTDGIHKGSQPFVLWKNGEYARHRRKASFDFLDDKFEAADWLAQKIAFNLSRELLQQENRVQVLADYEKFCSVFPDAFYISERGRDYLGIPKEKQEKGRLLSAGFHSMMGYYRDDRPLYDLVLEASEQQELDALWDELNFFTAAPLRQYQGFLWFDRTDSRFMRDPEFDFARPEDKSSLSQAKIEQLSEVYLAKAVRNGGEGTALQAIRDYFQNINRQIRWVERTRVESEAVQLDALIALAGRAFRRPLVEREEVELRDFYKSLRQAEGAAHEEALQDTLVSILMSPHFCYRVDLLSDSPELRRLNDFELASRLSYFLWSSLPDPELLNLAKTGRLHQAEVLVEQVQRMVQDERVRGLATEFGGNWLDFRRFEEHNSVDREKFPTFDAPLRSAMFEEPIRFLIDLIQKDRSTLDLLFSEHVLVNPLLAGHYGMTEVQFEHPMQWKAVPQAAAYGRGGLLTMSVFLTKNAPGLRTSPVKRGYWVVKNLLGERIPPPPPNVPDLPNDETKLGDLTLSETLAKHREHASCSGCHDRIDPLGLVFEGFGPIGEQRELDLGGRPVQNSATFPDGSQRHGVTGLREYLQAERQEDFLANFHRKLLTYALGRSLLLSDSSLLQKMQEVSQQHNHRILPVIQTIVTSPQFLNKRGRDQIAMHETGDKANE